MAKTLSRVRTGKGFEIWSDGKNDLIKFMNVRVSFPACGTKKEDENEDGEKTESWQVTPMLKKGVHDAAKAEWDKIAKKLCEANPTEKNGVKAPAKIPSEYNAMKNGDEKERTEYEGHWVVSCSEKKIHPTARTAQGDLIMNDSEIDKVFYGGVYCNVMVRPWFFNGTAKGKTKTYPKRICAGFVGIQHVKDGDPFGEGRIDDSDAWSGVEGGDDDGLGDGDDDI